MRHSFLFSSVLVSLFSSLPFLAAAEEKPSIVATVESTLTTGGERIRQFAFDGDDKTYFASEKNAT
ncbi:MAG TPA: secretory protein, partial [Gemmataceae bacterium]|nr:secretory protein [Gemmataceae bacterium]